MKKLSLAVFNTQPPHLYLGGVERRILETGKRLSSEVDFTVYSGTKAGFHTPTTVDGVSIVPCSSTDRVFPLDNLTFNRTLSKMANKINADVHESHNVSGYGFQNALKRRGVKAPFITTVHGVLADEYAQVQARGCMSTRAKTANFFMKRLAKIEEESAKKADFVVTISQYSKQKIVELYGVNPEKIRIVPNGVDPERFKPDAEGCRREFKARIGADGRQVVLFVGRLIPRKGLSYLIQAAKNIVQGRNQTLFVIVGDGPSKSSLEAEVAQANLSGNFLFLGDVSETDLSAAYACAEVFVFPSIQEGQGIALLEAQASATPVVAFNVSGVSEAVLTGETGLLVEPADSDAFADAVLKLLSDASLRQSMGVNGRKYIVSELTWDVCAQKMLGVYREAQQMV
ncbi:MAG: glycosyltransferase family 4 protein [Candidatus Bathyarchaeota archaeon]|nr:glycosyltransferase family 4 protein [Candidatus Bathyarchaeota archaeon]